MTPATRALRQARYERACWWLGQGVSLVPLKPGSKHLQPGYGSRQAHITTQDFARRWFLNTDANLGIVLGGAMGLAVADWDSAQGYEAWRTSRGATVETLAEQTARGYHLFFSDARLSSAASDQCEFKACGICMVAPSVHPSGTIYRIVQDMPIAPLSNSQAQLLFPFLSEKPPDQSPSADKVLPRLLRKEKGERGASLIQRIKASRSIVDELEAAGVNKWQPSGNNLVARCVFHKDDSPSLWVNPTSGLWGCNAPSCPAHDGRRAQDVINARALWRGISIQEAIKELADEFLPLTYSSSQAGSKAERAS